jgi:hypothetical protein
MTSIIIVANLQTVAKKNNSPPYPPSIEIFCPLSSTSHKNLASWADQ